MEDKKSYIKPVVVSLDEVKNGFGNCTSGSGDYEECTGNGNNAIGVGCNYDGNSASNWCGTGNNETV